MLVILIDNEFGHNYYNMYSQMRCLSCENSVFGINVYFYFMIKFIFNVTLTVKRIQEKSSNTYFIKINAVVF